MIGDLALIPAQPPKPSVVDIASHKEPPCFPSVHAWPQPAVERLSDRAVERIDLQRPLASRLLTRLPHRMHRTHRLRQSPLAAVCAVPRAGCGSGSGDPAHPRAVGVRWIRRCQWTAAAGTGCGTRSRSGGWPRTGSRRRSRIRSRPQAVQRRHGGEQRLGVGVVRAGEHRLGRPDLHHPAEVEHHDPVRQVPDHPQVVRDEQVRDPLGFLQVGQQVEDGGLHRDVERRGRLVADHDLRAAGERARDRDPLLEPAGQLARAAAAGAGPPAGPRRSARPAGPAAARRTARPAGPAAG